MKPFGPFVRAVLSFGVLALTSFAQAPSIANYSSSNPLAAAVSAIGSNTSSLVIPPGNWSVPSPVVVPSNISLQFSSGGVLVIAPGQTLTIQGGIQSDSYRIFAGGGNVVFTGNYVLSEVDAKWWGAVGDGSTDDTADLQAALVASTTASPNRLSFRLPAGTYRVCNLFLGNKAQSGCPENAECPAPARVYGIGGVSVFNARLKATAACGSSTSDFVVSANSMSSFTLEKAPFSIQWSDVQHCDS